MEENPSPVADQSYVESDLAACGDRQRTHGLMAPSAAAGQGDAPRDDPLSGDQAVAPMSGINSDSPSASRQLQDSLHAVCDHDLDSAAETVSVSSRPRKRSLSLDDENLELQAEGVADRTGDGVFNASGINNSTLLSDGNFQGSASTSSTDGQCSIRVVSSRDVPTSETVAERPEEGCICPEIQMPTAATASTLENAAGRSNESGNRENPGLRDYQAGDSSPGVSWSTRNGYAGSEDAQQYGAGIQDDDSSDWEGPVDVELEESPLAHRQRLSGKTPWTTLKALTKWIPLSRPKHPWVQMAGHQGSFLAGTKGNVLKLLVPQEEKNLKLLMEDTHLRQYIPQYRGTVEKDGASYVQLQDLLCEFTSPCVMDVKMGVRTYQEEELEKARKKPAMRKDLYQKMVSIDIDAPTEEERKNCAIEKPRYLKFRDDMSSTSSLGFRIEGIKTHSGASKDYKDTRTRDDVKKALSAFIGENTEILDKYISKLNDIQEAQESSDFFKTHEMVGSSLLFVHDDSGKAGVWMIDFAKCIPLPTTIDVDHRAPWIPGNFQDGYMSGVDNLSSILEEVNASKTVGMLS